MPIYHKVAGAWVERTGRPHVKRNGAWTPVNEGWVKRNGVWTQFYVYDSVPPVAPIISAVEHETTQPATEGIVVNGRHIDVSVRPGQAGDSSVRRIRLLVSTQGQPTSQYDASGYISGSPIDSPNEPWSEIYYNGYNGFQRSMSENVVRKWTRNPSNSTVVPAGTYYFSAWSEDYSGNWSPGAFTSITLAPYNSATGQAHQQFFRANNAGTYEGASGGSFTGGEQRQDTNPLRRGVYLYQNDLAAIKDSSTKTVTIQSAQIYIHRKNDNYGNDLANVNLVWHTNKNKADIDATGLNFLDERVVRVGTISKGESKWFDLPSEWWPLLADNTIKGFGLNHKGPGADAPGNRDTSAMKDLTQTVRTGEVFVSWIAPF